MNFLSGGEDPYMPIDPNPNPEVQAGYASSMPPPPPPGASEADVASYSMMPVPTGGPGTLPGLASRFLPQVGTHVNGAIFGAAGAAFCCAAKGSKAKKEMSTLLKGAAGGVVACWAASKKAQGLTCTIAGLLGGYLVARLWK